MPTIGRKFNLLPKEPIESVWDALWLGIRPLLCFYNTKVNSAKLHLLPKEPIESFWDALWLGIRPLHGDEKDLPLGRRPPIKSPSVGLCPGTSTPHERSLCPSVYICVPVALGNGTSDGGSTSLLTPARKGLFGTPQ